jgi:hypothetical protein
MQSVYHLDGHLRRVLSGHEERIPLYWRGRLTGRNARVDLGHRRQCVAMCHPQRSLQRREFALRRGQVPVEFTAGFARPTTAWVWRQVIEATPWGQKPRHLLCGCRPRKARAASGSVNGIG